jgi:hypothetical protein
MQQGVERIQLAQYAPVVAIKSLTSLVTINSMQLGLVFTEHTTLVD